MQKDRVPYGSDVSAGTFQCNDCGEQIQMASQSSLPPCPRINESPHGTKTWRVISGQGDATDDPQRSSSGS